MKVKTVKYNWRQVGSLQDRYGAGEDYDLFRVGENGVVHIKENAPMNGIQKCNYLVTFEDGSRTRVFEPNLVEYYPDELS